MSGLRPLSGLRPPGLSSLYSSQVPPPKVHCISPLSPTFHGLQAPWPHTLQAPGPSAPLISPLQALVFAIWHHNPSSNSSTLPLQKVKDLWCPWHPFQWPPLPLQPQFSPLVFKHKQQNTSICFQTKVLPNPGSIPHHGNTSTQGQDIYLLLPSGAGFLSSFPVVWRSSLGSQALLLPRALLPSAPRFICLSLDHLTCHFCPRPVYHRLYCAGHAKSRWLLPLLVPPGARASQLLPGSLFPPAVG